MKFERSSGVLLHPTSFPGPYGIGDLGAQAREFVDFLQQTHQKLWQVLPLTPTGYGDSPYAAFSAFAGNPLLISPDILMAQQLLAADDLQNKPDFGWQSVDYGSVIEWKTGLLRRSFELFKANPPAQIKAELSRFEQDNATWLDDYALFMAAKSAHGGALWTEWDKELALRQQTALAEWREQLADEIAFQKYIQFLFFQQWLALKAYANERDVKIIGDIPIFVAYDSADVWANPDIFHLDAQGRPTVVAGVPPDFFSPTGQYWGNPLYRWDKLAERGYDWWVRRFASAFKQVDILRLDHFRGFEAYWEVPVNDEQTAVNGKWVKGPGTALFQTIEKELGKLPVIVEDLGAITPEVEQLRQAIGYPGMRVLQFAFAELQQDAANPYLPHNYEPETVVYTGNHDNNTTAGWFEVAGDGEKANVRRYLDINPYAQVSGNEIAWKLVRLAWGSVAELAVAPLQDLLGIGSEGRMNMPGQAQGNWAWRYHPDSLSDWLRGNLLDITLLYARHMPPRPPENPAKVQE